MTSSLKNTKPDSCSAPDLFLCWPENDGFLLSELKEEFPNGKHEQVVPQLIASVGELTVARSTRDPIVAFSCQVLPRAEEIYCESIRDWAGTVVERIISNDKDDDRPCRLHIFSAEYAASGAGVRRAALIEDAIMDLLRKKRRHFVKRIISSEVRVPTNDESYVQLVLAGTTHGFLSICSGSVRKEYRHLLSPFPGGSAAIKEDKAPPSRAYKKLLEALAQSGLEIKKGERCVDLGASPGSWTYVALKAGAAVTAVDRSPLREDLMRHKALTFVRGDGFSYEPSKPFDWLLCDIISSPERTAELIKRWTKNKWCRKFCVTVKFKGTAGYGVLDELKQIVAPVTSKLFVRRLQNNKNEITIIGSL